MQAVQPAVNRASAVLTRIVSSIATLFSQLMDRFPERLGAIFFVRILPDVDDTRLDGARP